MTEQVWAVGMMKDEADIAYHVLAHLAGEGFDGIIVADNGSTDGTREELSRCIADLAKSDNFEEAHCNIILVDDPEVGYYQSRKMTELATTAASQGASWIVPFDADELWFARDRIAVWLRNQPANIKIVNASLYNHFQTGIDLEDPIPFRSMVWRLPEAGKLPKVAFRWNDGCTIRQGNHGVDGVPGGVGSGLTIHHFPYRSWDHFKRKAINGSRAYAATDLPTSEGAHWRSYGDILERGGEEALKDVYDTHFVYNSPVDDGLILDPAPFRRWHSEIS